jgi:hypothetical protein
MEGTVGRGRTPSRKCHSPSAVTFANAVSHYRNVFAPRMLPRFQLRMDTSRLTSKWIGSMNWKLDGNRNGHPAQINRFPFAVNLSGMQSVRRLASRRSRLFLENPSKLRPVDS